MNIDFRYRAIKIDKEKVVTSINIDDFPIEIEDDFLLIVIDYFRFFKSIIIDKLFFLWLQFLSISDINQF